MSIASTLRRTIPATMRAKLRRSAVVNRMLKWKYGGPKSKPHPKAPYRFHFDGLRDIGWAVADLSGHEHDDLQFALDWIDGHACTCVWDVGANIGFWSLALCGRPSVKNVVAFEPDPTNVRTLDRNKSENAIATLDVRQLGVSSGPGRLRFYSDPVTGKTGSLEESADFIGQHYGAERVPIEIDVTTIDEQVRRGTPVPQFIKVDVEGHELEVLRGGRETLATHRPALVMEVTAHGAEVKILLESLGYRLLSPATGGPLDACEFQIAAVPAETASS